MRDIKYCRVGWCRCEEHQIVIDKTEQWDRCNVTAAHTSTYERCPVPSQMKTIQNEREG